MRAICELYLDALRLHGEGVHVVSTDEKTGMQALERAHPSKPMKAGLPEYREFEYVRHGTQCLIASFEIATGRLIAPSIGPTRKEEDFLAHVQGVVATDPEAPWIFVADNLDVHRSESLVRWVAEQCDVTEDLGQKYKRGHLKSRKTRQAFLTDPSHRIRFVYTPIHCSWLNQIELWFSTLARKVLKRGSFTSLEDLVEKVLAFIRTHNERFAKPYQWTFTGIPLVV